MLDSAISSLLSQHCVPDMNSENGVFFRLLRYQVEFELCCIFVLILFNRNPMDATSLYAML